MDILGKDICCYLLQFVHPCDILTLSKVNKCFKKCIAEKFPSSFSSKEMEIEIKKGNIYMALKSLKYPDIDKKFCLYFVAMGGDICCIEKAIKFILGGKINHEFCLWALLGACEGKNIILTKYLVPKYKIYHEKYHKKCCKKHSASYKLAYTDMIFHSACRGGNIEIINICIMKMLITEKMFHSCLLEACKKGDKYVINYLCEYILNNNLYNDIYQLYGHTGEIKDEKLRYKIRYKIRKKICDW